MLVNIIKEYKMSMNNKGLNYYLRIRFFYN